MTNYEDLKYIINLKYPFIIKSKKINNKKTLLIIDINKEKLKPKL